MSENPKDPHEDDAAPNGAADPTIVTESPAASEAVQDIAPSRADTEAAAPEADEFETAEKTDQTATPIDTTPVAADAIAADEGAAHATTVSESPAASEAVPQAAPSRADAEAEAAAAADAEAAEVPAKTKSTEPEPDEVAAHEAPVTEPVVAAESVPDVAPAPAKKTRRGRRTEPAHAEPQTDAPDVEAAAAAALDAAESESAAADVAAAASGEAGEADGEATPAVGEGHEPPERLKSIIESLVFAADKPLSIRKLQELTGEKNAEWIQSCIEFLRADYGDRGVVLHEVAGGYQFRTNPLNAHWVQQLIAGKPVKLSRAQLETLAIAAYRQPITRPEIDEIRGVDSGGTLKVLLDRHLVRILGKKEEPGRPMLYGTTKDFLEFFNLRDLKELPTLREFYELNEDSMAKIRELDERRAAEGVPAPGQPVPDAAAEPVSAAADAVADETAEKQAAADPDADSPA